jgi:hypothetical protein
MARTEFEPNESGWLIELWWRPPGRSGVEKPIYWHGRSAPSSASGLNGTVAVFSSESEAKGTFETHASALPEGISRWNPVSLRTAQSRMPPVLATVTWGGADLAPQPD